MKFILGIAAALILVVGAWYLLGTMSRDPADRLADLEARYQQQERIDGVAAQLAFARILGEDQVRVVQLDVPRAPRERWEAAVDAHAAQLRYPRVLKYSLARDVNDPDRLVVMAHREDVDEVEALAERLQAASDGATSGG